MVDQRAPVDDLYSVILTPISIIWWFFPTYLRKKIVTVPRETILLLLKIIWAFMAYYWIWTMITPYVAIPAKFFLWYGVMMEWLYTVRISFWVWYEKTTLFTFMFPGMSLTTWLMTRFSPKQKEPSIMEQVLGPYYVPERAIQGSELIPAKELPSFVCYISGFINEEESRFVGCGFRVENAIITAAHNLTGYDRLKLISNTATSIVDVDSAIVHPYDDFAYFKLTDREFSMLGMSKGRLLDHAVPKSYPMICQVYGPGTPVSFTMGAVTPVENFGKVAYGGSTTHGFSGSPYIQNKTIVGMHLGAGMINLGLDAAYMHMLLSLTTESTEDWLMDMIEQDQLNKREVRWEYSPVDSDEVFVMRQGKYFRMDADTFFTVFAPQSFVSESFSVAEKLPINPIYSDSKNSATAPDQENVGAGASGPTSVIRNCVQTPLTATSYQTPTSINLLEETLATAPQEPTPALRNNRFDYTSNDTTYQPERNRRRQQQKLKKFTKSSQRSTNPGSPGLELIR